MTLKNWFQVLHEISRLDTEMSERQEHSLESNDLHKASYLIKRDRWDPLYYHQKPEIS